MQLSWLFGQFELFRHGSAPNMGSMEGLRGFAVFLVFLVHYVSLATPWISADSTLAAAMHQLHTLGSTGVDLFFVLSGYLIYGSLMGRAQGFLPFIRRRIVRIYPAFCAVFALYLLMSVLFPQESRIPPAAGDAWMYICQNFLLLPGLFDIAPMITVAWSLSYEMFFYLALPAAFILLRVRERSSAWRVAVFLVLAATVAVSYALYGGHVRMIMFIAGMLLHEALRDGSIAVPRSSLVAALLGAGLLGMTAPIPGHLAHTVKIVILACIIFIVCYACFSRPAAGLSRSFSWTPLRWLGNMSYSYYLIHGLALKAGFMLLAFALPTVEHELLFFLAAMPLMFGLTLLPSAALFLLIERPFSLAQPRAAVRPAMRSVPCARKLAAPFMRWTAAPRSAGAAG